MTYEVDFPMFAKIELNGDNEAELYTMLKVAQPGDGDDSAIRRNSRSFASTPTAKWSPAVTPAPA